MDVETKVADKNKDTNSKRRRRDEGRTNIGAQAG